MNFKKSEVEIIKLLISSPNFISSYDIATATGISRRSVRDEMINIKIILNSLGYELISKTSKGYIIDGKSPESLQTLSKIIENAERQRESVFPTLPWERRNYIMKRLLDKDDYIKIDQLADELLISRSTISNDLKGARSDVKKYNLTLKQKPNYGLKIIGDEIDKRKPISDFWFTNLKESNMFYDYLNSYITDESSLEYGIITILKKYKIEISDIALCDFLITLTVSLSRITTHRIITSSPDLSCIKDRVELNAAKDIASFLEHKVGCDINEHEINHIAIALICKRSTQGLTPENKPETQKLIAEIIDEIYKQTLISFNNIKFYEVFTLYIESALLRLTYNEKIRNPLYDEVKTIYPVAYELAQITSSVLFKHTNQLLSRSEIAFFTVLFNTTINQRDIQKKKVLLLSGLGGGAEDQYIYQILEQFENQIDIVKTSQYYKLPDEDLSLYDFIISGVPIHKKLSIPYINISPIITQDDLNKINNYLSYLFNKNRMETIFHPKLYKDQINAKTKVTAIKEFFKLLKEQYPQLPESFKNSLMIKDHCSLILHKNNIGLLKLQKPINNNNILSVLIFKEPLYWDRSKLKMIILFSCRDDDNYIYNTLTNTITDLSSSQKDIDELYTNPSYQNFIKKIIKYQ